MPPQQSDRLLHFIDEVLDLGTHLLNSNPSCQRKLASNAAAKQAETPYWIPAFAGMTQPRN
jgi:hypothetical protein